MPRYFGSYFDFAVTPTPASYAPPPLSIAQLCHDEDIAILDQSDFAALVPQSQAVALADDGAFAAGDRWVLTSASVDFAAQGVVAGQVAHLTRPPEAYGQGGALFVVEAATSGGVRLRRLGRGSGVGQPPAPAAGLEEVEFAILTFGPQITLESADVRRLYDLDRRPGFDLAGLYEEGEELRRYVALRVLRWAYVAGRVGKDTDGQAKIGYLVDEIERRAAALQLRWGPTGEDAPGPTGRFNVRVR